MVIYCLPQIFKMKMSLATLYEHLEQSSTIAILMDHI